MLTVVPANYLETEVLTAAPQKLQLMLVEAAIRFIERGRECWNDGDAEHACEAFIRAQEVVTGILGGLNRELNPELARTMSGYYVFVFRNLAEANIQYDQKKIEAALEVLHVERETWQQVCEMLQGATSEELVEPSPAAPEATSVLTLDMDCLPAEGLGSFSIEA